MSSEHRIFVPQKEGVGEERRDGIVISIQQTGDVFMCEVFPMVDRQRDRAKKLLPRITCARIANGHWRINNDGGHHNNRQQYSVL